MLFDIQNIFKSFNSDSGLEDSNLTFIENVDNKQACIADTSNSIIINNLILIDSSMVAIFTQLFRIKNINESIRWCRHEMLQVCHNTDSATTHSD